MREQFVSRTRSDKPLSNMARKRHQVPRQGNAWPDLTGCTQTPSCVHIQSHSHPCQMASKCCTLTWTASGWGEVGKRAAKDRMRSRNKEEEDTPILYPLLLHCFTFSLFLTQTSITLPSLSVSFFPRTSVAAPWTLPPQMDGWSLCPAGSHQARYHGETVRWSPSSRSPQGWDQVGFQTG